MAPTKTMSSNLRNSLSSRSYQPPQSYHCRSTSIGGQAWPSGSLIGILRSSMNTTNIFLRSSGPSTPFLLRAVLDSTVFCTQLALVQPEKAVIRLVHSGLKQKSFSSFTTLAVLPVPVGPVNSTCLIRDTFRCKKKFIRTLSLVGIKSQL